MQFHIKKPCKDCPFRLNRAPYLTSRRAQAIAKDLTQHDHNWFACHETTGAKTGEEITPDRQSQCMGSMIVQYRERSINVAMRLALAFRLLMQDELSNADRIAGGDICSSFQEFIEYHSESV